MLVYGITLLFLAFLASLPMFLGWVVLLPLVFTSLYASYSGIFPAVTAAGNTARQSDVNTPNDQSYY
jgi:hypothetical protein